MANFNLIQTLSAIVFALTLATNVLADEGTAEREFTMKVLPLLESKCFGCHGDDPKDVQGAFDVRSRDALLKGGESEEASIVPGDPKASLLYQAVKWEGIEMPPKENDRLTAEEVEMVGRWIKAGAPWPDEAKQKTIREAEWAIEETEDGVIVQTSGGLSDQWTYRRYQPEDLWAFRPVEQVQIPNGVHPIDYFIEKRFTEEKVTPAVFADPVTLIRRATFDLTGLPPTPKEILEFQSAWNKDSNGAWTQLIDRLLESPHYGERWAQHWLDVTRYADTGGMSNDFERSNMWRYRDYVIRSFNNDKPYDRFVIEQLAGDELADASVQQRKNGDAKAVVQTRLDGDYTDQEAEWIVATGFLRLGPWDNAMIQKEEARQIYLDDVVNVVGQTFLSTTMRCFKCHDHKFDPLPTRDYYRVYAAFSTTIMAERTVPFLSNENRDGFESGKAHVKQMLKYAVAEKNQLTSKREAAAKKWFEEHDLPYVAHNQRSSLSDEEKPPRHVGLDHTEQGQLKVREQDEWIWNRRLERYEPMAQSVYNAADFQLAWNGARKLRISKKANRGHAPDSFILTGGALTAPGLKVGPGVLSAVGLNTEEEFEAPYLLTENVDGRRLGLAKWIANPDNSLATRSIVNRIWQHHFGKPLAGNPNNFGVKGAKPTHPDLLDWLTADFVANGWTMKRIHRLIMTSKAYRQSSEHAEFDALQSTDPNNDLLAYFPTRRLTAEELRDAMLHISGELNPASGGLPAMPEINMEVALQPRMIQFSLAPAYQPSPTPEERNRRSVYAYQVRGQADPFMEVFNMPNPNESCEVRDAAAVSPQAFSLMNSDLMHDRALGFAIRLEHEEETLTDQIRSAFSLALCRLPTADEQQKLVAYVTKMQSVHQKTTPVKKPYPTKITRSLVEEFSGEPFEYEEILPIFETYVSDPKPSDAKPSTRALADLCLILFNSNEFMYIY